MSGRAIRVVLVSAAAVGGGSAAFKASQPTRRTKSTMHDQFVSGAVDGLLYKLEQDTKRPPGK